MELAERIGVSFQQIQKYEKGITKIYVARLSELADALNVRLDTFTRALDDISYVGEAGIDYSPDKINTSKSMLLNKEERILLKLFRKIRGDRLKKTIIKLLQNISDLEGHD